MRKKIEWQWEKLDDNSYRAKVIGGWIVSHWAMTQSKNPSRSESTVFIPDRDHDWQIIAPHVETPKPPAGGLELFGKS